jgi:hypothetical protein
MLPMARPFKTSELRKLRRGMSGDDVAWLHIILNYHLGPPDDQLPITGPDAYVFGPLTLAKVKRFQKANSIDIGTPDFMDGIVGQHTWAKLNDVGLFNLVISLFPKLKLTPPVFPQPGGGPRTPQLIPQLAPPVIPEVPASWHWDNIQVQSGDQVTAAFGDMASFVHQIQIMGVYLKKSDGFHTEVQLGPQATTNAGFVDNVETDVGLVAALNLANMPFSGSVFTWSVLTQLAVMKSLNTRGASGNLSTNVQINVDLLKAMGIQSRWQVQATGMGGLFAEVDAPASAADDKWRAKAGALGFIGFTIVTPSL